MGEMLDLGDVKSYVAGDDARSPVVVLVHDYFGFLPHVRTYCDDLLDASLRVVAPDLYEGHQAKTDDEATRFLGALGALEATKRVGAALAYAREGGSPMAVVGFSAGGWYALDAAASTGVDAAVAYYAIHDADQMNFPLLCHFAEHDEWPPDDRPEAFVEKVRERGGDVEAITYPGTEHGFANADIPAYDKKAARDAWRATVDFLRRTLSG